MAGDIVLHGVATVKERKSVYLMTAVATAIGTNGKERIVRILFDGGSSKTFVLESLVAELCWPKHSRSLMQVSVFGDQHIDMNVSETNICLKTIDGKLVEFACTVTNRLISRITEVPCKSIRSKLSDRNLALADDLIADPSDLEISILIGTDTYSSLCTYRLVRLSANLVLIETVFGWTLFGSEDQLVKFRDAPKKQHCFTVNTPKDIDLSLLWAAEGIQDLARNNCQEIVIETQKTLKLIDNRYIISLPWISKEFKGNNFKSAMARLRNLISELRKKKLYDEYQRELFALIENKFAEEVHQFNRNEDCYYLPHRAVYKESGTTRIRIVFDPSTAGADTNPLNTLLTKGVNINPNLHDVLLRFRKNNHAIVADIKQAFLQIRIAIDDRRYLRFLWIDKNEKLRTFQMCSIPFGTTASPFLLAVTLQHHLKVNEHQPIARMLQEQIYVDDIIVTTNEAGNVNNIRDQTTALFGLCSMPVHKWRTSLSPIDESWTGSESSSTIKVLGSYWDLKADTIGVRLPVLNPTVISLRTIVQQLGSFYDPLGLAAPIVIKFKIFIQSQFKRLKAEAKLQNHHPKEPKWDAILPEMDSVEYLKLIKELKSCNSFSFPRQILISEQASALAVFGDAGTKAYGAVAYLIDFQRKCSTIIMAKTKVTPMEGITIPKAELLAAVLAAQLFKKCANALSVNKGLLFTDSTIVAGWLNTKRNSLPTFEGNRVKKILELTSRAQWRHVSTLENPADLVTKLEMTPLKLLANRLWAQGPAFLLSIGQHEFPTSNPTNEIASSVVPIARSLWQELTGIENIKEVSWKILMQAMKKKTPDENPLICLHNLLREIQITDFHDEMTATAAGKPILKTSKLYKWVLIIDEHGLLRRKSRLRTGDYNFDNPIILDGHNPCVRLFVDEQHRLYAHLAKIPLADLLRQKFWIIGLNRLCYTVTHLCKECQLHRARPRDIPLAPVPLWRITKNQPFACIGIDFAGPLVCKSNKQEKATTNKLVKRWVLLATCAVSRAIHMEVLSGVSTEDVWTGLRRLTGRRGPISFIYSDNGSGFVRTAKDIAALKKALEKLSEKPKGNLDFITWQFSAPFAPWQNGFVERMIGTVKTHLAKMTQNHVVDPDELVTLLIEIEGVVNSRPIGKLPNGRNLTPAHIVLGHPLTGFPPAPNEILNDLPSTLRRYITRQKIVNGFWNSWKDNYLAQLRTRFEVPNQTSEAFKPNDHVIVLEPNTKRGDWPVGKIVKAFPPAAGSKVVRKYLVELNGKQMIRAAHRLTLLEDQLPGENVAERPDERTSDLRMDTDQ